MNRRGVILAAAALASPSARGQQRLELRLGDALAEIRMTPAPEPDLAALLRRWIGKSAEAVMVYYGKFPVSRLRIALRLGAGRGVRGGQTFPGSPPAIRVNVGLNSGEAELMRADWVMVHEMIHLAFPWMDGAHNWMAEGIAVYVESLARVQAGHLPAEQVWNDFVKMMPRGLPEAGDRGLDLTPSWGRTYWGGAIFCLEADIRIRRETDNRFGLQQALRAINATRNFSRAWPFRETLELGDEATGHTVLADQYDRMREAPVSPDLAALWRDLGVEAHAGGVTFDDDAPLAAIRLALTRPI